MCPIKIVVPRILGWMKERGEGRRVETFPTSSPPRTTASCGEKDARHWRAQERDIIFMLSPCVSTPWLPWMELARESETLKEIRWNGREREGEKEEKKKEKETKIGGLTVPCLQTPRVLIATHYCQGTMDDPFVTCLPKPSHRKTIESNREESDFFKNVLLRFQKDVPSFNRIQGISTISIYFFSSPPPPFPFLSLSFTIFFLFLFSQEES